MPRRKKDGRKGIRYRTVETQLWSDAKFMQLTRDAQLLWLWLLTGPSTTILPGVLVVGRLALTEAMKFEGVEEFDRCFAEIESRGMVLADWQSRVVWLPNAIKHNPPDNPSVVAGWEASWREVPQCALKNEIEAAFRRKVEERGAEYASRFYAFTTPVEGHRGGHSDDDRVSHAASHQDQAGEREGKDDERCAVADLESGSETRRSLRSGRPPRAKSPRKPAKWRTVPEDFALSPADVQFARDEGLSDDEIRVEERKWRNHEYRDAKSDPSKAWRTWATNAAEFRQRDRRRGGAPPARGGFLTAAEKTNAAVQRMLDEARAESEAAAAEFRQRDRRRGSAPPARGGFMTAAEKTSAAAQRMLDEARAEDEAAA